MKRLRNWDNKTWLSSKKYITSFNTFLKSKINFNQDMQILDIGCGRANIISALQKKYNFNKKPIGIDVVKNGNIKKNIIFNKINALKYLKRTNKRFDLILIKQTIHFFNKKQIKVLLTQAKSKLNNKGQIIILTLKTKNNKIPCFKKMRIQLNKSLKKDETILKIIKKNLKNSNEINFKFKVSITKKNYLKMIKNRYISCLLNISTKDLSLGISELNLKLKNQIYFTDTLKCITFKE
ncbi:class I SAM-dependent methyltransferase [Pelagibacteraceae bacterium]|jgi:ubiquinone/menaquinone biosynthesis C-methylase UbiE|nr:class I SAM-dependent methyltransferase [Pelagibacteraceae bacterium]|tara:strand:+ start:150 stop:860 length:711 start_codon:yes stop_codon:yes gene_type:complete